MLTWMQPYNKGRAASVRRHVEKMSRILHMLHIKHITWAVSSNCEHPLTQNSKKTIQISDLLLSDKFACC